MARRTVWLVGVIALVVAASWATDTGTLVAQANKPAVPGQGKQAAPDNQWPPRTSDGQPDIQGVWFNVDTGMVGSSLEPMTHLRTLGAPTLTGTNTSPSGGFRPAVRKPTIIVDPTTQILPYQPWALERRNSVMKNYTRPSPWQIDPLTRGWPNGVPRVHIYSSIDGDIGGPWQVLQGPGFVLFLYETHHEFRYVPLDGRPQPGRDVALWMGSSRGRWEGNALIIETTNNNDSTRFDIVGDFHSDALRVTERFTYVDKDTLEYTATIDDPKVYTQPWTIAITNKRSAPGTELIEYAAVEGETSVDILHDAIELEREAKTPEAQTPK